MMINIVLMNLIKYSIIFLAIFGFNFILEIYHYFDILVFSETLPKDATFDFIVVGAGTAGSTIISSELSKYGSVLLIEAGGNPFPMLMTIPALSPLLHQTRYDWRYETTPQSNACGSMVNSRCKITMGKGIGGSNLLNNMIYHRGDPEDYRNWFKSSIMDHDFYYNYTKEIEPLFERVEQIFKPTTLNYLSDFAVTFNENLENSLNITFEIPKVLQKNGQRSLGDIFNDLSSNVKILKNSLVTKVSVVGHNHMMVRGVEYLKDNKIFKVTAKHSVILSAGTIGTPKILLQSGIGPCDELYKLGIVCVKNLSGVGKNLQDHIATGMDLIRLNYSLEVTPIELLSFNNVVQYFNPFANTGRGPLSTVGCEILGFDKNKKIGFMVIPVNIASDYGIKLRHVMNLNEEVWEKYFVNSDRHTVSILPILLHPKSRGDVKLKDSNPKSKPIINPNYLSNKEDIIDFLHGIELLKSLLNSKNLKSFGAKLYDRPIPGCQKWKFDSTEYWRCYIKKMSFSLYHPVGTCQMGGKSKSNSVVDEKFQVEGILNLYIVDASVMPNLPSGNPNAAVMMLTLKFLDSFFRRLYKEQTIFLIGSVVMEILKYLLDINLILIRIFILVLQIVMEYISIFLIIYLYYLIHKYYEKIKKYCHRALEFFDLR